MKTEKCKIISKKMLLENILEIEVENNFNSIKEGQFFNIKPRMDSLILRRPISVNKYTDDSITFVIRLEGEGTKSLTLYNEGEYLDLLGPLGNSFPVEYKEKNILLIGGGVGVAPLVQLGIKLSEKCSVFSKMGFEKQPYQVEEFLSFSKKLDIYIDKKDKDVEKKSDNMEVIYGEFPTLNLSEFVKKNNIEVVYTCGPEIMMKSIYEILRDEEVEVYVSLEERMGCGVGACLCCTKKVTETESVCVCKDGPVFKAEEVFK